MIQNTGKIVDRNIWINKTCRRKKKKSRKAYKCFASCNETFDDEYEYPYPFRGAQMDQEEDDLQHKVSGNILKDYEKIYE